MRTTVALDDELVAKAQALVGLKEKSTLIREALKALIERESARRLARLGGSEPGFETPRRRPRVRSECRGRAPCASCVRLPARGGEGAASMAPNVPTCRRSEA